MISGRRFKHYVCLTAACLPLGILAQTTESQEPEPPPPANLYTLHVYTNLVQVPTLVLNKDRTPLLSIAKDKFNISLDEGPRFHPTQMRMEGEDAISLAVLIDDSGDQGFMLKPFVEALARIMPQLLHPQDSISFYAADCTVIRLNAKVPTDSASIRLAMEKVLQAKGLHGLKEKPACGNTFPLWDNLVLVSRGLAVSPTRRVLLVLSNGHDGKSQLTVASAIQQVSGAGVAVFGVRNIEEVPSLRDNGPSAGRGFPGSTGLSGNNAFVDNFGSLCESSGGLVFSISHMALNQTLKDMMTLIRNRYIIEFPRPDESTPGHHDLLIEVPSTVAYIRPTGVSTPLPDPALRADPNTLPSSASPAKFGTKRTADQKH